MKKNKIKLLVKLKIERVKKLYPGAICPDMFKNPMEAKSCISKMDFFVGSRMHATIATFSSHVAVIPAGYSKKFIGLFKSLDYDHILDFRTFNTEQAVKFTLNGITERENLKQETFKGMQKLNFKLDLMKNTLENKILKLISEAQ